MSDPVRPAYDYITDEPDYRHLEDRERYRALYEEVGSVPANQIVRWREEWMKYFRPTPGSSILELGAHNGPNLLHYGERGHVVDGVEISRSLIATFQRYIERQPAEVKERVRMIEEWIEEFAPDRTYDYVLCTEILEHVSDPVAVLRVAWGALSSAGTVYISSPATHWGNNTHVRGVPLDDLERWMIEADLVKVTALVENDRTFCLARAR